MIPESIGMLHDDQALLVISQHQYLLRQQLILDDIEEISRRTNLLYDGINNQLIIHVQGYKK